MNNRISVIGVEGSGKSYFISNIFCMKKYEKIYEPNFEINKILKLDNDLIEIKDKQKLIHDCMLTRDTKLNIKKKYIMERDFISAVYIFKVEDNLFYKQIIDNYIKSYNDYLPHIVVFFDTPAEICLERIQMRKRVYEKNITLSEIKEKIKLHYKLLNIYEELNIKIYRYTGDSDDYYNLTKFIKKYKNRPIYNFTKRIFPHLYRPRVIVLEGNIGSGKSSILTYYKKNMFTVIDEPFDKMQSDYNIDFLKTYYNDQNNRYSNYQHLTPDTINFQSLVYQYKLMLFNNMLNREHKNNIIFIERTILSGLNVFCKSNILSKQESNMLELLYQTTDTKKLCYNANEIIYIDVKPDICMIRLNKRDIYSDSIELDLLRSIDINYNQMLKKIKSNGIKVKRFTNEGILEEVINNINVHLDIKLNTIKSSDFDDGNI